MTDAKFWSVCWRPENPTRVQRGDAFRRFSRTYAGVSRVNQTDRLTADGNDKNENRKKPEHYDESPLQRSSRVTITRVLYGNVLGRVLRFIETSSREKYRKIIRIVKSTAVVFRRSIDGRVFITLRYVCL